jgi:hypothetical protein
MKKYDRFLSVRHAAVLAGTIAFSVNAPASVLNQWGTGAVTVTNNCATSVLDCTFNQTYTDVTEGTLDQGLMQSAAYSFLDTSEGTAEAQAVLNETTGISTPTLRTRALGKEAAGGGAGLAFAVEGYTNESGHAQSYNLDIALDAVLVDTTPYDLGTGVVAFALVVKASADLLSFNDVLGVNLSFDHISELYLAHLPGSTEVVGASLLSLSPMTVSSDSETISFNLADGESVYFAATLTAFTSRDGSSADAFGTLTSTFQDPTGLAAASTAGSTTVPEPTTVALMGLGLAGIGYRRKKAA